MEEKPVQRVPPSFVEGIDVSKLGAILRSNWIWIVFIFLFANMSAYVVIRYSKNVYESQSVLKLDIKSDATELGIQKIVEDQSANIMSGEIELIQSKLFLTRIVDSLGINVTYFSRGEVLDYELYKTAPFRVVADIQDNSYYNTPILLKPTDPGHFVITMNDKGKTAQGRFGKPLELPGATLTIAATKKPFEENINYIFLLASHEAILNYLQANVTVQPLDLNANTISVSFKDNNPAKARDMVNKIDSMYLQFSDEQKNLANIQKIHWLNNELTQIEQKMESYEEYFEDFTLQNRTNDLDEDLKRTVNSINLLDSQRFDLSTRIANVSSLRNQLAEGHLQFTLLRGDALPTYILEDLQKLQTLSLERDKLGLVYSENTFAVKSKATALATLKKSTLAELETAETNWSQRLRMLDAEKANLERQFATLPDKSTQYNKNQRYYKLFEELYLGLMQAKSGFEITQAGSTPDFKILSPGTLSPVPIAPRRSLILAVGFVASIVLNIFFVGLLYLANNKITSVGELERSISLPVLGVIPSSRKVDHGQLQIISAPRSMVSESFRTLRTNLDFFSPRSESKVIAISSTVSGEGKSFVARNLGGVMAVSKKRVALVDLDMRKKPANGTFDRQKGMSTILIGKNAWKECVQQIEIENMDFIPSGPLPPNPSELLLNGEFDKFIQDLREHYEYIILDTPPVGVVTDGIMAMKIADLTIYIFRANYSKREFIQTIRRLVNINKLNQIAMLLNALPSSDKRYGYGYYEESHESNWFKSLFSRS